MRKFKKYLRPILLALVVTAILCVPAFAASGGKGNVGAVVESTWKDAAGQIKTVVNNVVFPALDMAYVHKYCQSIFLERRAKA